MKNRYTLLWTGAAYTAFACLITWPLVLHFRSFVIGDLEGDMWKHLWGFWWMKDCLVDQLRLPLETRLLNYPYGGSLFFIDPLGGILSVPLQLFLTVTEAYNALILFNLVVAALGAYLLAFYLVKSRYAAFVSGVIYGFCPFLIAYITSGVTEALNVGWIPFFMLYFMKTMREHRIRNAVIGGFFFFLATVGCWYYGTFCILLAFCYFVYHVMTARWGAIVAFLRAHARPSVLFETGRNALSRYGSQALLAVCAALFLGALPGVFLGKGALLGPALFKTSLYLLGMIIALHRLRRASPKKPPAAPARRPGEYLAAFYHAAAPVLILAFAGASLYRIVMALRGGHSLFGAPVTMSAVVINVIGLLVGGYYLVRWEKENIRSLLRLAGANLFSLLVVASAVMSVLIVQAGWRNYTHGRPINALISVLSLIALLGYAWYVASLIVKRTPPGQEHVFARGYRFYREHLRRNFFWLLVTAVLTMPVIYYVNPLLTRTGFLVVWLVSIFFFWSSLMAALYIRQRLALVNARAEDGGGDRGLALYRSTVAFYRLYVARPLILFFFAGVLILPVAVCFKSTLNKETSLVYRVREEKSIDIYLSKRFHNIAKLVDYVTPGKANATRTYTVDKLTRVSYCGWVSLILALLGLVQYRRKHQRFWLFAFLFFVTLSMGPFFYINETIHMESRFFLYMLLYKFFPLFSQVSIPYRFNIMAMLALAISAGFFLSCWLRHRKRWEKVAVAGITSLAILLEVTIVSPAPYPIPLSSLHVPEFCRVLGKDTSEYGVIDIPIQRFKGELLPGEYFYYQMFHRKGIPNKVEGTIPLYVFKNIFTVYLFNIEHSYVGYLSERKENLLAGIDELQRFKVRYFIVHDNYLRAGARERVHGLLTFFFGKPVMGENDIHVYSTELKKPGARETVPVGGGAAPAPKPVDGSKERPGVKKPEREPGAAKPVEKPGAKKSEKKPGVKKPVYGPQEKPGVGKSEKKPEKN